MNQRIISTLFVFLIFSCVNNTLENEPSPKQRLVESFGGHSSFEIATWNIEQFPKSNYKTTTYLAQLIRDLDIDLIAFQEINDTDFFQILLDSLSGYEGICSRLPETYMKLGLIYKRDQISINLVQQLFIDDDYCFPRPPLYAYVQVKCNNQIMFDFSLINIHLKAYHDTTSIKRRKLAALKLKMIVEKRLFTSNDKDVIILGDWNDELADQPEDNIFLPFLEDSLTYTFLIPPYDQQISYPPWESRIDHILISNDVKAEYRNGTSQVIPLNTEFKDYSEFISDHLPVAARFYVY
jgi:endonuclease/exonuclease/phosphatase family metal-dependent hydrolase